MNRKRGIVLIVWSISALALGLVSIITADWIHTTDGTIYVGLWKRCDKGDYTNYDGKGNFNPSTFKFKPRCQNLHDTRSLQIIYQPYTASYSCQ